MKIFGYLKNKDESVPSELAEISIMARPEELRKIAEFYLNCADELERPTEDAWDHKHFSDLDIDSRTDNPEIIVVNPSHDE